MTMMMVMVMMMMMMIVMLMIPIPIMNESLSASIPGVAPTNNNSAQNQLNSIYLWLNQFPKTKCLRMSENDDHDNFSSRANSAIGSIGCPKIYQSDVKPTTPEGNHEVVPPPSLVPRLT